MKTIQAIIGLALAASFGAGCSYETDMPDSHYPADNVVRVTASVDEARTRSYTSETLNSFYLSIHNPGSEPYSYGSTPYLKNNGIWEADNILLWQNDSVAVDIIACTDLESPALANDAAKLYELNNGVAAIKTDQASEDKDYFTQSDFLIYKRTGFVPKNDLVDGKLAIVFQHGFSLLNIQITLGTEFNQSDVPTKSPVDSVTIKDMAYKATVDFTQTPIQMTAKEDEKGNINAHHGTFETVTEKDKHAVDNYACILIPQTLAAGSLKVELLVNGSDRYIWTSTSDFTLESGKKYQLKLTLGKDAAVAGEITSQAWNETTGGELETE